MNKLRVSLVCLSLCANIAFAQQPSANVDVLPAYPNGNASPPFPPPPITLTDALRGDGYLQRQVEGTVANSTYNPDHILAAFGDYRTTSIPNDTGLPGAASSGWIGLSRSYDRGHTWFGSMVPCFPGDTASLCSTSPLNGLQTGSDPSLATTPGGHFYLGALFFTTGHISNVAVVHYRDVPDTDGGDAIRYQGVVVVDKGSQSDSGNFIDKPWIGADIARGTPSASVCGPVYIAYTIFNGGGGSVPFTSKVGFAHSSQGSCGATWSKPQYLNKTFKQNQGTAIAIDPNSGKVYVFWRHVYQAGGDGFPDAIVMVSSTDGGNTFSNPVTITPSSYAPFDQPGLTTTSYGNNPAFRSNSFPAVAIDGNGTLYVASQEKTSPTGSGYPSGYYEPRVVLRSSKSGGRSWTVGSIVDQGGATYAQQFMPALSFGGGLLKLLWYDFRDQNQASLNIAGGWYVAGLDRQMKTYVAQSNLSRLDAYGNPVFSTSIPVSQYLIDVNTGQVPTVGGVAGSYLAVNRPNLPMYSAGTTAFTGDYNWQATASPFVPNLGGSTAFRWATHSTDYIALPTFGVWTDSRDVVFPTSNYGVPTLTDLLGWQQYAPPGTGLSCTNAGARNSNLYLSEIKPGVIAASPATSRQLVDINNKPMERAFPLYIQNPNSDAADQSPPGKFFRISFNSLGSPIAGSFSQGTELTTPITSVDVNVLQYSTATVTLYVYCSGCSSALPFAPFSATVQQIDSIGGTVIAGGAATTVFFDSDPTAPFVTNPNLSTQETHNASVSNPQYTNPQYTNPQYTNPQYTNPQYTNPQYTNPQYTNVTPSDSLPAGTLPVGEFVWTITDIGNNASAYTAVANIAQSNLTNRYVYEAIISRSYNVPGSNSCNSQPIPQDAIISIIPNPQYTNPQYTNPQYTNPQYTNPQYTNATFAAVPPPPGSTASAATATSTTASSNDGTTKMPVQTDHVYYVLRVYRADGSSNVLSTTEQNQIIANTSVLVFPQAPNTGQGTPTPLQQAPPASNKTFTTTALISSPPSSVYGQTVSLTATVTPSSGSGTPSGSVDFRDGEILLQTVPTTTGKASLNVLLLSPGTHTITAIYSGDVNFVGSVSNAIAQVVGLATTTTSIASSLNPSVAGNSVTFTVTVTPEIAGTPTGTASLYDGANQIASGVLTNGTALFSILSLSVGTHSVTATYGGDSNFFTSQSTPISQQVNAVVTNTLDAGPGSLRQAILDVNAQSSPQPLSIVFNITGDGVQTIAPASALPTLTQPAVLDGTTQPGYDGIPIIELNGGIAGSGVNGLHISAGGSTVRGFVINQFGGDGILIDTNGSNTIQGNYIGTDVTGAAAQGNSGNGIHVVAAPNNLIGGSTSPTRNLISGNGGEGLRIDGTLATGNVVQGNYIGTDASGSAAIGNKASGVYIRRAPANSVTGNLVSGNSGFAGITICGNTDFCGGGDVAGIDESSNAAANVIQGNLVGSDPGGTTALPNQNAGVSIDGAPNTKVGGTNAGAGNVISFNMTNDVQIFSAGANGNKIVGNTIHGNTTAGGNVGISVASPASGNTLSSNSISGHAGLGIDLSPAGVNANQPGGANNYPAITSAQVANGTTTIVGTLNSTANATFTIEFFSSPSCNASGYGEGATFLGSNTVTTDASGDASFSFSTAAPAAGNAVTTTSTDANGTTSEFSACAPVTLYPAPPTNVMGTNNSGLPVISWTASTSSGVTGYNVYRATTSGGGYTLVGNTTSTTFTDPNAPGACGGTTYYYVVTAIGTGNAQSANSNETNVIVQGSC